jgi:hypothetical protein
LKQPGFGIHGIIGIGNRVNIERHFDILAGGLFYTTLNPFHFRKKALNLILSRQAKAQAGL